MSKLDSYLAAQFARIFAMCVGVFVGLFLLITLFERLGTFLRHKAAPADCALYLLAQVPWMLIQVMPMACLLATLVSLTLMSRGSETTALRSVGISLVRIARPFVLCGALVCALTFALQETVIPKTAAFSEHMLRVTIRGGSKNMLTRSSDVWMRYGGNWVFVKLALPKAGELREVEFFETDNGQVVRQLKAASAKWEDGSWTLTEPREVNFTEEGWGVRNLESMKLPIAPPPEELAFDQRRRGTSSMGELQRRIRSYTAQGLETKNLRVQWWSLSSLPFASMLMPLLAVPFGLRSSRRGGMWTSIGVGVTVSFVYLLILMLGSALGQGGYLPPWLAAWSGNFIFFAIALLLFRRAEKGT